MKVSSQITLYGALLMTTWLIWSGHLSPLLIAFGALSCALATGLILRMQVGFPQERFWLRLLPRLPRYWLWLLGEVTSSNLKVAAIILDPRLPIHPRVVKIDALPTDPLGRAILGNCITLTPGTVTLNEDEGMLTVHCITAETAAGLQSGEMNRRIAELSRA